MLTIGVDAADQLRKVKMPVLGNPAKFVPEYVFQADTRLVTADDKRTLYHSRFEVAVAGTPCGPFR